MTINEYIEKLENYSNAHNINADLYTIVFGCDNGPKYTRVWTGEVYKDGSEAKYKCVFCFVDHQGNIYKPAGWKAPAKGVRGHLDGFAPMECRQLYAR